MHILFIVFAALIGLLLGGIINALADDLPFTLQVRLPHYPDTPVTKENINEIVPESDALPQQAEKNEDDEWEYHIFDGAPRPPIAWLGTFAFLTGRRTAPNGLKLSWRQPAVEIVQALLFAYIATLAQPLGARLYWMGCVVILMLITVIDLEHRLILFAVIIPGCIYALVGAALVNEQIAAQIWFRDYLIGGLMGFIIFFLMYLGGILFSKIAAESRGEALDEVAFGYGDVMLATLSGFMIGWQALIFAIFIAVFAGAAGAIVYLLIRLLVKGKYEFYTALPYGQYIVFGTVIMMIWREPVIHFIEGH